MKLNHWFGLMAADEVSWNKQSQGRSQDCGNGGPTVASGGIMPRFYASIYLNNTTIICI